MAEITREGCATLGKVLRAIRISPAMRTAIASWVPPSEAVKAEATQSQFARWLAAKTGLEVGQNTISRFENGEPASTRNIDLLIALVDAKIFWYTIENGREVHRSQDGPPEFNDVDLTTVRYYKEQDLLAVLKQDLDPFTGSRRESGASCQCAN